MPLSKSDNCNQDIQWKINNKKERKKIEEELKKIEDEKKAEILEKDNQINILKSLLDDFEKRFEENKKEREKEIKKCGRNNK